jgi:hypothetical protein
MSEELVLVAEPHPEASLTAGSKDLVHGDGPRIIDEVRRLSCSSCGDPFMDAVPRAGG